MPAGKPEGAVLVPHRKQTRKHLGHIPGRFPSLGPGRSGESRSRLEPPYPGGRAAAIPLAGAVRLSRRMQRRAAVQLLAEAGELHGRQQCQARAAVFPGSHAGQRRFTSVPRPIKQEGRPVAAEGPTPLRPLAGRISLHRRAGTASSHVGAYT